MLNEISIETIENNKVLRDFILFDIFPNQKNAIFDFFNYFFNRKFSHSFKIKYLYHTPIILLSNDRKIIGYNKQSKKIFKLKKFEEIVRDFLIFFKNKIKFKNLLKNLLENKDSKPIKKKFEIKTFNSLTLNKNEYFKLLVSISISKVENMNFFVIFLKEIEDEIKKKKELQKEKQYSVSLLLNILPPSISERLEKGEENICEKLDDITILFCDIYKFSEIAEKIESTKLVSILNEIILGFENVSKKFNISKIKTIDSVYFCVSGLHIKNINHAENAIEFGKDLFRFIQNFNEKNGCSYLSENKEINESIIVSNDNDKVKKNKNKNTKLKEIILRIGINTGLN